MRRSTDRLTSRRRFLGAAVSLGVGVGVLAARRGSAQAAPTPRPPAGAPPFDLDEGTHLELGEAMGSGRLTARAIAEKYLGRIEAIDRGGPALRSVIELNPDALAIADALDRERKGKGPARPAARHPVLIKDNIDTADRMATTAGSLALVGREAAARRVRRRAAARGRARSSSARRT